MKRNKETTATYIVLQHLIQLDDFATAKQIAAATKVTSNRVGAALHELRHYKAVFAESVQGTLYWAACPDSDTRMRKVLERTPEEPGTRKRKRKAQQ